MNPQSDDISRFRVEGPYNKRRNPQHQRFQRQSDELAAQLRRIEFLLRTRYHIFGDEQNSPLLPPPDYVPNVGDLNAFGIPSAEAIDGRAQLPPPIKAKFEQGWKQLFNDVIAAFVQEKRDAFLEDYAKYHPREESEREQQAEYAERVFSDFERVLLDETFLDAERQRIENAAFAQSYPLTENQLRAVTRAFLQEYAFADEDDESFDSLTDLMAFLKANADPRMLDWYFEWLEENRASFVERTSAQNAQELENFVRRLAAESKRKFLMNEQNIQNMYRQYLEQRLMLERYRSRTENARFAALLTREAVDQESIPLEFLVRVLPNRYELLDSVKRGEQGDESYSDAQVTLFVYSMLPESDADIDYATAKRLLFAPVPESTSALSSVELIVDKLSSDVVRLARWLDPDNWARSRDIAAAYYSNKLHRDDYDIALSELSRLERTFRDTLNKLSRTQPTILERSVSVRRSTDSKPVELCVTVVDTQNAKGVARYSYTWYQSGNDAEPPQVVRRVNDTISARDCLRIEPTIDAGFVASQAGDYYCIARIVAPNGTVSVARSTTASVIVESYCVRCLTWFDEADNRFGECVWHDRPTSQEKRAMLRYNSERTIDQPTYEGLLARFNAIITKFDIEQREVDFDEWLADYPNIALPVQSNGHNYAPTLIYQWLSRRTGRDETLLDNPRDPLPARQTKCLLRILEVASEELESAETKRRKLTFGATQSAIWSEAEGVRGLPPDPRTILDTDISPTLVLQESAPLYENLSLLAYPLFNRLLTPEDRRFVNTLLDRFIYFASDYKIYARRDRIPLVIQREFGYPQLAEVLGDMFLNMRMLHIRTREVLQLKRELDARKVYNTGVSARDMFRDLDMAAEIRDNARRAALNTGVKQGNEAYGSRWACCMQEAPTRGCWKGLHSSTNSQPTPYQLNETSLTRGSYHLYWGYDFEDIDRFIRGNHEAWMMLSVQGNESEARQHFRAAQIGAVVFNHLQTQVPRRLGSEPNLGWNELMRRGIVDEILEVADVRSTPDGTVFRDAFVLLDPEQEYNAQTELRDRERSQRQFNAAVQEVEQIINLLDEAGIEERTRGEEEEEEDEEEEFFFEEPSMFASSSALVKKRKHSSAADPYLASGAKPTNTITNTHEAMDDDWHDMFDWGGSSESSDT